MRQMGLTDETTITIQTRTTVFEDGKIVTSTVTTTHGNAVYTSLGQLHGGGAGDWWVTNGNGDTLLVRSTKRGAVEAFANQATTQAATWAAHKDVA